MSTSTTTHQIATTGSNNIISSDFTKNHDRTHHWLSRRRENKGEAKSNRKEIERKSSKRIQVLSSFNSFSLYFYPWMIDLWCYCSCSILCSIYIQILIKPVCVCFGRDGVYCCSCYMNGESIRWELRKMKKWKKNIEKSREFDRESEFEEMLNREIRVREAECSTVF